MQVIESESNRRMNANQQYVFRSAFFNQSLTSNFYLTRIIMAYPVPNCFEKLKIPFLENGTLENTLEKERALLLLQAPFN